MWLACAEVVASVFSLVFFFCVLFDACVFCAFCFLMPNTPEDTPGSFLHEPSVASVFCF